MKQKFFLLVSLVLLAIPGRAAPVDESSARTIVHDFLISMNGNNFKSMPSSGGSALQLVHAEKSSVKMTQNSYYIYNTGGGFVIVAGDDRAEQILGYGDRNFDMNNIPCGLQAMLNIYKEQIDYLLDHPELEVETPSLNAPKLSSISVLPLLKAKWDQDQPYNNQCPFYNGSNESRCVTGCCCTSLCQVMYYWKYPTAPVPSIPAYTTMSTNISLPALPSTTFDWDNMLDTYKNVNYTVAQANAIAWLMRYVGQAEEMGYGTTYGSIASIADVLRAAKMFGYDHNAKYIYKRNQYTDAQWASLIQTELRAGRPIIYTAGDSNGGSGHCFNLDGYDRATNTYHINWGWSGIFDGYFALNAFNINSVPPSNFNEDQMMIIGLKPQTPEIEVNPDSLSFSAINGKTKTASFEVKGYALNGDLVVKLNNANGIYAINKTSISRSDATDGATVTVSYSPTTTGSSNASVSISGGGASPKTVSLSGSSTAEIIVNPTLDIFSNVYVGTTAKRELTINGYGLTGDLSVEIIGGEGVFSVDKTCIPKNDAISGSKVIVSYSPTAPGQSTASVVVSGGGADSKTAKLSGTAVQPEITVTPISISFNALAGDSDTKTFLVKGSHLLSNITLSLNDESGNYSIDKTRISKSDATNGDTVTVTFNPTKPGKSTASIIVNSSGYNQALGAEPKSVTMNGTAFDVDVNRIVFEPTYTGYQTSKTITITCPDLKNDLQLSLSNDYSNSFGLSKSTITPEAADAGAPVTIYFSPTTGGGKHAKLNIVYDGCKVVTIPIGGAGIKSDGYITAWPTELTFETQAGTPVTETFKVTYTYPNGSVMISKVNSDDETAFDSEGSNESVPPTLNASSHFSDLTRTIIPFDSIIWRPKAIIDSLPLVLVKSLVLELTGDDCFDITPSRIRLSSIPCSTYVTVTYHPDCIGEHDGNIKIWLFGGSARPFILPLHGTATAQFNYDNEGNDLMITQNESSINTLVNEMLTNTKVYAEGLSIIIESPVEQKALISDIAGHVREVNLQAGRNEVPVNSSGIYFVRIREKTTKLMLK